MAISYANIQVTKVLTLRGNTIQNNRYTGLPGELTVDTQAKTIRIHDGVTPGGNVIQGASGASSYANANVKVYLSQFDGNIIPSANAVYNLGTVTNQWKSLFVSNSTIYVGGVPLSIDATGNLTVNGNTIPTVAYVNTAVANVTVDLSSYALNANVTAANVGLKGYVDFANTTMKAYVDGQITAANTNVSSSYSNVQVATYLPTYSGNVANLTLGPSSILTFADGTTQITAGGGSYSNVQVATYLPTYAGTVSASLVNSSGNILSTGLSVFGNTRIGLAGAVSGQFHSVVGNITQTSSGGAVYINTTGNLLAAAVVAGAVTSTGTVAVNAATGITTNQATFLLANATATTINMGGAATTINLGTTTSATGNVFVGGQIGSNAYNLTLRANGRYNVATSINSNGGFNSPPYANQPVIGGSGTGMTANYSSTGGYIDSLTIYNSGTGYRNGDVISVPGGIAGNSFVLQNYSANRVGAFTGTALYTFGIDGNLVVPGNVTATTFVGSGALLTSLPGYAYSNVNVASYLNATGYNLYSNVNVASYLSTATINTTGNITAAYLTGNISITGNVVGTSPNVTIQAGGNVWVFDNTGNLTLPTNADIIGAVTFTGNVTAPYFIGNGALLTGIAASSNYSNVNVATYLPTYSGNIANIRLGVAGVLTFADGTTQITAGGGSYSNVQVATYLPTYSGNVANIRLGISGVLTFADGTTMTSAAAGTYSNVQVATYLPTYTGSLNASNILVTSANITIANIQATNSATNPGTGALRVMGGVGVAGAVVAGQLNSTGNVVANAISAYSLNTVANVVASLVNAGNVNASGNVLAQNLIGMIATASQTNITAVGALGNLTVTGNVTSSNFVGLTPNVQIIANTSVTTFDVYGNVTFPGNNIISSLGITMPTRPAFRINGVNPGSQSTANTNLKGSAITTVYNQGNYFDATTGKFTAPISGIYEVLLNARINGSFSGAAQLVVLKNGLNSGGNIAAFWETSSNTGGATHFGVSGTINLVAGDYLSANILLGNVTFDQNDNWCVTYLG